MYGQMSPPNPRKRPASGSPVPQAPQMQPYSATNGLSNADFLKWSQGPDNAGYVDPDFKSDFKPAFNMNNYGGGAVSSQSQYDSIPAPSTQLARRPVNRQLVPTAQRVPYDNAGDPWGQFGDDSILDPQNSGSRMEENDNIELLEEKAAVAKRDAQSKRKQIPPFVQKLSSFLDDGKNTELIRWSERGDSFVVLDEDEFAKTLIPELFKHNNYASFVRQLNMYGFHKRVGLSDNSMKASERKNKSPSEYYNPYFKRNHPNLLWLINKPKGGSAKNTKKRRDMKDEAGHEDESDDDGRDGVEQTYGPIYGANAQNPNRAISAAPESGPLQRRDMAVVQKEIQDIQKNQAAISQAITRLRKDHNQLYQQAVAFQTLHDRHESSINAILTFLATVYNRSLDGNSPQPINLAQMFTSGMPMPQEAQHQGNVVDIGDLSNQQQQNPGNRSPLRRNNQRLLMGPPTAMANQTQVRTSPRATTLSPASAPQSQVYHRPGAVEEIFETSPGDTSQLKVEPDGPQQDMMDIINNTNAMQQPAKADMFGDALSHMQYANGQNPLTNQERDNMLNMMMAQQAGGNNVLGSPAPPVQQLDLNAHKYNAQEIEELERMSKRTAEQLAHLENMVVPLSPSGSIPGMSHDSASYFNGHEASDPHNSNLDLDQYLDTGAFYNNSTLSSPAPSAYDPGFIDIGMGGGMQPESHFDLGMDGAHDMDRGRIESAGSSEVNTPEPMTDLGVEEVLKNGLRSPTKRRRKN